ncbi:DoxX family membrane protein, partial [Phenylobacterium sp.]|uniref:DoxX family membrane protein n=1 Tax=Phenylobacterium sp. TaxID=1871053 RepID=UPI002F40447B
STVMTLGGLLAYAKTPRAAGGVIIARAVRWLFGAALLVFGISHFVYAKFTASMVPAWLPPAQIFWAWATGVAQVAAGLAVLTGVQARLAAILLSVMYAAFSLLVHIPLLLARPHDHGAWAENGVNLVLVGAAWGLAEMLSGPKSVRAAAR